MTDLMSDCADVIAAGLEGKLYHITEKGIFWYEHEDGTQVCLYAIGMISRQYSIEYPMQPVGPATERMEDMPYHKSPITLKAR